MINMAEQKAKEIQNAAQNSFGIKFAANAFSFQIKQMIEQIKFIENQLWYYTKKVDKKTSYML